MHCFAASSKAAHRRVTRAGADMRALAAVTAMTIAQGVVVLPPRSPGPGLS